MMKILKRLIRLVRKPRKTSGMMTFSDFIVGKKYADMMGRRKE